MKIITVHCTGARERESERRLVTMSDRGKWVALDIIFLILILIAIFLIFMSALELMGRDIFT